MRRRFSIWLLLPVIYVGIYAILYFVLPLFLHGHVFYGSYFPLFFFFPFFFGRRRFGRRNSSSSQNPQSNGREFDDTILNSDHDTSSWDRRQRAQYDEYGIRRGTGTSRYWYYASLIIIVAAVALLLYFRVL